jgi:hypothetical protein
MLISIVRESPAGKETWQAANHATMAISSKNPDPTAKLLLPV